VNRAFMFPGQGSQVVGMGKSLYEEDEEARRLYDDAEVKLGLPLKTLSFEGPFDTLTLTQYAQPALFVAGFVAFRWLLKKGVEPDMVFGHSLGELVALAVSEVLDWESALNLVKERGRLMGEAGKKYPGAMAAVIGLDEETLQDILNSVNGIVVIANYNSPGQLVISGEIDSVKRASEIASERGAKRVIPLKVSAAFHSPLMKEPAEAFSKEVEKYVFKEPKYPVGLNATGEIREDPVVIKEALKAQLLSPVRFTKLLHNAYEMGTRTFIEVGPGNVLQGLVKRTLGDKDITIKSYTNF